MSYQAWEDLLDDDEPPASGGPSIAAPGVAAADASVLQQVPALAELMRQRSELEQRMASLLGGGATAGDDGARDRRRFGGPPGTAVERTAARKQEAEDAARRQAAQLRAAERRWYEEKEALRRQGLLDRGRRQLSAQQRRLEDAARRRVQHGLEQAEQRYLPEGTELRKRKRELADAIDHARAPLADWKGQRAGLRDQLRAELEKAKADPELQEALRDDPTALDGIDEELDRALAVPDAWVERIDAQAQRWSDRLRTPDTWGDRDRRLSVDRVVDGIEQIDRLRQLGRELAESRRKEQRKDERAESRREGRRRERKATSDDGAGEGRGRRRARASNTD